MKKVYVKFVTSLLIMLLLLTSCNAQKFGRIRGNGNVVNKIRNVGNFDKIGVSGSFDIMLVKGDEGKIEIKIEDNLLPYLITEVDSDKLKIRWKKGTNISTNRGVKLVVYFKDISGLALSGSGDIKTRDIIVSNNFDLSVAGSGDIDLKINSKFLKTSISGSSDIKIEGKTDAVSASISGSGDIDALNLSSKKANLKISGSGDMKISVRDELTARVSGSGNVIYKGSPRIEDIKVSGSGEVSTY